MTPELVVREDANDVSVQIRVQKVANGFLVRTGKVPIYYATIEAAADAARAGLIEVVWPN